MANNRQWGIVGDDGKITLTAQWVESPVRTITFDTNGGSYIAPDECKVNT